MLKKSFIGVILIALIIIIILITTGFFGASDSNVATQKSQQKIEEIKESDKQIIGYKDVTAFEAKNLIEENPGLIIIDVSPRYKEGHLPGAINYYIGDGTLEKAVSTLDKEAMYLVYCHVDSASIPGAQRLIDEGIKNVYRLKGNYAAWVEAGYPIER